MYDCVQFCMTFGVGVGILSGMMLIFPFVRRQVVIGMISRRRRIFILLTVPLGYAELVTSSNPVIQYQR